MGQNTVYIGFNNIHGLKASTGGLGTHPPWIRGTTVLSKIPGLKKKKKERIPVYLPCFYSRSEDFYTSKSERGQ